MRRPTSLEICAGAGGQALGLEMAGFDHVALIENDPHACATLRLNRPHWNVIEGDLRTFDPRPYVGVDLVAGGVPCPPFSIAGKQLGAKDDRDLFPAALRIVRECKPQAVMIENVRGILDPSFDKYREWIKSELRQMGYVPGWKLLNACHYGVPQLRPRVVLVAISRRKAAAFSWPVPDAGVPPSVGIALLRAMSAGGWTGAEEWAKQASGIAPTIVGGSKKHGGPDLGPTRAKRTWASMQVDGLGVADHPPGPEFEGRPRLTVQMVATLQGFPPEWRFAGRKTNAYRQVGNAFPPPVARAVGRQILECLKAKPRRNACELAELAGQTISEQVPLFS